MLKTRLVGVTAGLVKPRKLIWKGKMRKAPDMPPMEVKKEITSPTSGGTHKAVSTPETGKVISTPEIMPLDLPHNGTFLNKLVLV
jgi:hypothetical protein